MINYFIDSDTPKALNPSNRASDFATWVYKNTVEKKIGFGIPVNKERLKMGTYTHEMIDEFFKTQWMIKKRGDVENFIEWKVIRDESDNSPENILYSSALKINNKPISCQPDLVLEHVNKNKIIIIERKSTTIPANRVSSTGWPNIEAQLWCYSWIDDWSKYSEIFLIGQIWTIADGRKKPIMIDDHFFWKKSDQAHHQRCKDWFEIYGGQFVI